MGLRRIQIEGFRAIRRLDLTFDDLTVLIGEHASGKSSVIAAIERCLTPGDPGNPQPPLARGDFREDTYPDSPGSRLSITVEIACGDSLPTEPALRPYVTSSGDDDAEPGIRLRLRGELDENRDVTSTFEFVTRDGTVLPSEDAAADVERITRTMPAIVIHGGKGMLAPPDFRGAARDDPRRRAFRGLYARLVHRPWSLSPEEIRAFLTEAVEIIAFGVHRLPGKPAGIRTAEDLVAAAPGALRTSIEGAATMAAEGDLNRALAVCTLFCAMVNAVGHARLDPVSRPLFVFDDIEAHLHPTWIARIAGPVMTLAGQKILSTHSPEVIAWTPLGSVRRLQATVDGVKAWRVGSRDLTVRQRRKVSYHVRSVRSNAFFAQSWLLVEGESESWLLPEFAALMGVEFASEGIRCIEFAQSGLSAMIKLARALGIEWHLLVDGDAAGRSYADNAMQYVEEGDRERRISVLTDRDIEHCLFHGGYEKVYEKAARKKGRRPRGASDVRVISRALLGSSKPDMAIAVLEEAHRRGREGVPEPLRQVIERVVQLSRATLLLPMESD